MPMSSVCKHPVRGSPTHSPWKALTHLLKGRDGLPHGASNPTILFSPPPFTGRLQAPAVIFLVLNSDQLPQNTAHLRNSSLRAGGFLACQQGVDVTAGKLSAQK